MTFHTWILAAVLAAGPAVANAATFYVANLNGGRQVPANASGGSGLGRVTLNDAETQITVSIYWSNLTAGTTAVRIHGPAAPGMNGPIVSTLVAPLGVTSGSQIGTTLSVTPSQIQDLKAGRWYFNIATSAFPGGEIRGQLDVSPVLVTSLSAAQVVPATAAAAARGRAWISLNEFGNIALVSAQWNNLTQNTTGVHLHAGRSGTAGAVVCDLTAPPTINGQAIDRLCVLTPSQAAALKSRQMYIDVHTPTLPGGEIRGQIKRSFNPCDFDGDGRSDQTIIRNNGANLFWWVRLSSGGVAVYQWGTANDLDGPRRMCPDIDGDGKADPTIYRQPQTGPAHFWTLLSSTGAAVVRQWGSTSDDPVSADFDGDGRDDYAIFRDVPGQYWILRSTDGGVTLDNWGIDVDWPHVAPDYDGDGKTDVGVQRGGTYWTKHSADNSIHVLPFGIGTDLTHALDFDGDGRSDIVNGRNDSGQKHWWILSSLTGGPLSPFGSGTPFGATISHQTVQTSADYDGDGRAEIAIWTTENSTAPGYWWTLDVKTGAITVTQWGSANDVAAQFAYWR